MRHGRKCVKRVTMQLGQTIRALRQEQGLTQDEVARRARLSRWHLTRIEGGTYSPRIDTLRRIAKALKTDASSLLAA